VPSCSSGNSRPIIRQELPTWAKGYKEKSEKKKKNREKVEKREEERNLIKGSLLAK